MHGFTAAAVIASMLHVVQAQENKKDLHISVILPFAPLNSERVGVIFGNLPAIQTAYALQNYAEKLNNDPDILPEANIKLQFMDSNGDGYGALTAAANTVNDYRFSAAIGELYPESTFAMSVAFQYGGVLQCVPGTSPTWLSNKRDYPNLFTTGSSAEHIAFSMIDLVAYFKVDIIGILVADSNFGGYSIIPSGLNIETLGRSSQIEHRTSELNSWVILNETVFNGSLKYKHTFPTQKIIPGYSER